MKVKILRDTVADGKDVYSGEVLEISDSDARTLIRMGKAEAAEAVEENPFDEKKVLSTANGPAAKKPGRPAKKE